jgi:voltage-gated potassium channel
LSTQRRLRAGALGILVICTLGTIGYIVLEDAHPFDAFYMVMITVSTVGFGEVFPLSRAGEVLTLLVLLSGVGFGLFTAAALVERVFLYGASRLRVRMLKKVGAMSGHVILCGFGRVGEGTWEALRRRDVDVAVIEIDPDRCERARVLGARVLEGDATDNDTLRTAGVDRASAVVACVTHDSDNLVVVLSARSLAPSLHIVSRASQAEWESKLHMAGADRVVAPQQVGSERLAAMATQQTIADMFDVVLGGTAIQFTVQEMIVSGNSPISGSTIRASGLRETTGALILAMEDTSRTRLTAPSPDQVLEAGTALIVVGTPDQVNQAVQLISGTSL